jgi:ribosomal protein S24E
MVLIESKSKQSSCFTTPFGNQKSLYHVHIYNSKTQFHTIESLYFEPKLKPKSIVYKSFYTAANGDALNSNMISNFDE